MNQAAGAEVAIEHSKLTGLATFIGAPDNRAIPINDPAATTPELKARSFIGTYGAAFGLRSAADVRTMRVVKDELGMDHVRMQQVYAGVPVTGGELVVHLRKGGVVAANGKTVPDLDGFNVEPGILGPGAADRARSFLGGKLQIADAELSEPRLEIFSRSVLEGKEFPTRLAWFVEARKIDVREFIWIDARSGATLMHFSQLTTAKNRIIYNTAGSNVLPGTQVRSEGGAATGDPDADLAYNFAGDTYDYYFNNHGRDSFDGIGGALKSTVHYCNTNNGCNYQNAFWNGTQMVYGNGFSAADDVDAHELTHAVTERTAGLFYYMQSGALNESFSDIFGETVDLLNGAGNDAPGVRWYLGEDIPGIGAIRNMMDPTLYSNPGKMTDSAYFACTLDPGGQFGDSGGVHTNSGVPNHAYALMVDGGTYNGQTVTGIGLTKAGKIEYRALTHYLTSASDFLDDYNALNRSCVDLIGTVGITSSDCTQVNKALLAVQMTNTWPCAPIQPSVPAFCPANQAPTSLFFDDFSSTSFGAGATVGSSVWSLSSSFDSSPTLALWGDDPDGPATDSTAFMTSSVAIPASGNARFQFLHSWGFESSDQDYDGGVVEYSTNAGASWNDAAPLFSAGAGYNGTIACCDGNPLASRNAFVEQSFGYTATQYSLASLANQNVRFRFRIGADSLVGDYGWYIDDVRLYSCVNEAPPRSDFDADRQTDLAVYHQASGLWYRRNSTTGAVTSFGFGGTGYTAVAGDYDGDNKTDEAVFHEASGLWFIHRSSNGTTFSIGFGGPGYVPVARDYDGDGMTDIAVYNPPTGLWYIRNSHDGSTTTVGFGGTGYTAVPGDYDGDGKADLAVFHAASGLWFFKYSSTGTTASIGFGGSGYTPVPADYDGDGRTDLAVYHPPTGLWYTRSSYSGATTSVGFGGSAYTPVPGDYDGDGKADLAVYHNASGLWYVRQSLNGYNTVATYSFGGAGFTPIY